MTDVAEARADVAERLSFSTVLPNLQIAWDSTSLGALKLCPRYYQYSILEGWTGKGDNVHLTFGIEFHAALEFYDRLRAQGEEHNDAVLRTVCEVLTRTWDPKLGRPWLSDNNAKNRHTLLRAVVWYLDQFQNDPLETVVLRNGHPAVELSFRFELERTSRLTGEQFLLCGHMDKLAKWEGRIWVVDRKTTGSAMNQDYFARYSPDNQVSLYTYAGAMVFHEPIAGLIIDAGQTAVGFARFQRGVIARSAAQLDEWEQDLSYWLSLAESFAEANYWPQNDASCNQYGGCRFREICGMSPALRAPHLKQMFGKRTWDPLSVR